MDRAELKKRVRALLISSKQGCTPNNLLRDYKSVFGESLPLTEFGYRTVVAMAEDMPDVVRIHYQGSGYGVILRGIADDSTRHIAKMVSRQRNTGYHSIRVDQPVRKAVTMPTIPFHIQGCLRQLLHAYPNGLLLDHFEEAYARRFGYYLSLRRLKCSNLMELINNVPDVLKIDKDSAGRTVIVGEASRSSFNSVESDNLPSRPTRFINQSQIFEGQPIRISDQLSNYDDTSPNEDHSKVATNHSTIDFSNANGSAQSPVVAVPVKVKENILKLLHTKHLGIWCTSLQEEYKKTFGHDLELAPFRSIMELVSNMKDVCIMEKPNANSGDWLVRSREQPSEEEETDSRPAGNFKEDIGKLMQDFPSGILLSDLPILFKQKYKYELPVDSLGFNSIASLVNSISDVVKKVIQNGQLLIVPATKATTANAVVQSNSLQSNGGVENDNAIKANEVVESNGVLIQNRTSPKKSLLSSPVEPMMSSEYIPLTLPQSTTTINVTVSHAVNPSKFFIQLIGKNHSHALNTLMMTISKFYCSVTGVEKVIARPVLGQACCAPFDGDGCWYRAEVIGIPTPFTVLVKYVDYGNVCELPIGSIRKSQPEYLVLPAQSIECCLTYVKPKDRVWSEAACKVFQEAVDEKPLVAFVQQPFVQQSVMSHPLHISLCDTSTKEDVYIHEILINKGLAVSTVEHRQPTTPTSSDAFMLSQFKEQFLTLQHTLMLQQQMLQQQIMVTGQLKQNGQVNGNDTVPSWQLQQPLQPVPSSQGTQLPAPVNTNSEHRKKMAAAKDIWSSDSETEDEKSGLNSSENMTKQLQTKLERLNEERRNILERMTYNSTSGSISSLVEKLQNIEGAIKATQENLKRRANGLPPLPPPGLSHMQPAKQPQVDNHSTVKPKGVAAVTKPIIGLGRGRRFNKQNSLPNSFGETTITSVPAGEIASSPVTSNSSEMFTQSHLGKPQLLSNSEMFGQDHYKNQQQLTSSNEVFSMNQLLQSLSANQNNNQHKQQLANSSKVFGQGQLQQLTNGGEMLNQDQPKRQQHMLSSSEVLDQSTLQLVSSSQIFNHDQPKKQQLANGSSEVFGHSQLVNSSEGFDQDQSKRQEHSASKLHQLVNGSEMFSQDKPKKQQLASNNEMFGQSRLQEPSGSSFNHDQPKKQHLLVNNSIMLDQNQLSSSSETLQSQKSLSNDIDEQPQKQLSNVAFKQMSRTDKKSNGSHSGRTTSATPVTDTITRSFAKLSLSNNAPPFIPAVAAPTTTHSSSPIPVVSSRVMSYSSAVTSQPPRKPPPIRPQQQFNRVPLIHQPTPLLPGPLPHMYGQNHPQVVGLGRGVGPWSAPPPSSWGGNGHYMHKMPPPPMHFNFDHHSPFYEIPSSGHHNPFYPIPPMGSSSGLDII